MIRLIRLLQILFPALLMTLVGSLSQGQNPNVTPEQMEKVHSHLFRQGERWQIQTMLSRGTGDVHVPCNLGVAQSIVLPLNSQLATLTTASDLVVLAKAQAGTTHVNDDQSFLYTDWNFTVEEVLKDNPQASVPWGATILVTRLGGHLEINGRMVYANCPDFEEFVTGREYVLYLKYLPQTGAYVSHGWGFLVSPVVRRLNPHTPRYPGEAEVTDKEALLSIARDAVGASAKTPPGGQL